MERRTKIISGIASIIIAIGFVAYYLRSGNEGTQTQSLEIEDSIDPADREKINNARQTACEYLSGKKNTYPETYERYKIINGLKIMQECVRAPMNSFEDYKSFVTKYGEMCTSISEGLKKNRNRLLHPILKGFYEDLHKKLCQAEQIPELGGKLPDKLNDLKSTLGQIEVLKPDISLDKLCKPVLEFSKNEIKNFQTLAIYISENRNRLKPGGYLQQMIIKTEATIKKTTGKESVSDQELIQHLLINVDNLQSATEWIGTICFLPIDRAIEWFGAKKKDDGKKETKAELEERIKKTRSEILPILNELLELIETDKNEKGEYTEKGKVAGRAVTRILLGMEKIKLH